MLSHKEGFWSIRKVRKASGRNIIYGNLCILACGVISPQTSEAQVLTLTFSSNYTEMKACQPTK